MRLRVGDEVLGGPPTKSAGAFAEVVVAQQKLVVKKPASLSFEDAATLGKLPGYRQVAGTRPRCRPGCRLGLRPRLARRALRPRPRRRRQVLVAGQGRTDDAQARRPHPPNPCHTGCGESMSGPLAGLRVLDIGFGDVNGYRCWHGLACIPVARRTSLPIQVPLTGLSPARQDCIKVLCHFHATAWIGRQRTSWREDAGQVVASKPRAGVTSGPL